MTVIKLATAIPGLHIENKYNYLLLLLAQKCNIIQPTQLTESMWHLKEFHPASQLLQHQNHNL